MMQEEKRGTHWKEREKERKKWTTKEEKEKPERPQCKTRRDCHDGRPVPWRQPPPSSSSSSPFLRWPETWNAPDIQMIPQHNDDLNSEKKSKIFSLQIWKSRRGNKERGVKKIRDVVRLCVTFRSPARLSLIGGSVFDETQFVPPLPRSRPFFLIFYLRLLSGASSSSRPILSVGISGRQQQHHMLHSINSSYIITLMAHVWGALHCIRDDLHSSSSKSHRVAVAASIRLHKKKNYNKIKKFDSTISSSSRHTEEWDGG